MDPEKDRNETIDLITRYFNALKSGDFNSNLFMSDVTIFTPFMEAPFTGEDAVINELKEISKGVEDIKILHFVIEAEFACAIIEFKSKSGITVDMCDTYRIIGGKFAEIRPYFDPRTLIGDG
ncbi:MAG TPA: nuclear transport factor 2 family protein [Anaerolineales bacterium]|nr:nuclear transport factor 2 family protein [Anaerolineales bacterium]